MKNRKNGPLVQPIESSDHTPVLLLTHGGEAPDSPRGSEGVSPGEEEDEGAARAWCPGTTAQRGPLRSN
jgi:hypothetical protein